MTDIYRYQKSLIETSHKRFADSLPCGAIISSSDRFLIYRNPFSATMIGPERAGSNIKKFDIPPKGSVALCEICGKNLVVSSREYTVGGEKLELITLSPDLLGTADLFRKSFFEYYDNLSQKNLRLVSVLHKGEEDEEKLKKFSAELCRNQARLEGCVRLMTEYSLVAERSLTHEIHPFSLHAVLTFCKEYLEAKLASFGVTFDFDCPPKLTCMINPRDFSYGLISAVNFSLIYTKNRSIFLSAREDGESIAISMRIRDRYDLISLYRGFIEGTTAPLEYMSDLFLPLGIINTVCAVHSLKAEYVRENDDFVITVRIKSSLSLPRVRLKAEHVKYFAGEFSSAVDSLLILPMYYN